jgi:hypothetical protein
VLREPTPKLVRYRACTGQAAVLLIPLQATGQQANFEIKADVRVREDSFACKEISELDRLLQINQREQMTAMPSERIAMGPLVWKRHIPTLPATPCDRF